MAEEGMSSTTGEGCGCLTLIVVVVGGLLLAVATGTTSPLLPILTAAAALLGYVAYGFVKHR